VLATSFDDLQKRVEAQSQQTTQQQQKLTEMRTRIASLSDAHTLKNAPRLAAAVATQARLSTRLLSLARHLHLLIPSLRASALSSEEEALRVLLQELEGALRSGSLVGKMNELWARTSALRAAQAGIGADRTQWAVVDEDGLAELVQVCC
jgi:nuclear pore complex protein Nup54